MSEAAQGFPRQQQPRPGHEADVAIAHRAPAGEPEGITTDQLERAVRTNVHRYFWTTRAGLPHEILPS